MEVALGSTILLFLVPQVPEEFCRGWPMPCIVVIGKCKNLQDLGVEYRQAAGRFARYDDVRRANVRRRFDRSIKNFLALYRPLADSWFLFDNSLRTPSVIALEEQGRLRIMKPDAYDTLVAQYGNPD